METSRHAGFVRGCCICSGHNSDGDNPLFHCIGEDCDCTVHKECYVIIAHRRRSSLIAKRPWMCCRCEDSGGRAANDQACKLCPNKEGAFRRAVDGSGYVHVVCARYIPEAKFRKTAAATDEEVISISKVPPFRYDKSCCLCEHKSGACINCARIGCDVHFHVTCAQRFGLLRYNEAFASGNKAVKSCAYCPHHLPGSAAVGSQQSTPEKETDCVAVESSSGEEIKEEESDGEVDPIVADASRWAESRLTGPFITISVRTVHMGGYAFESTKSVLMSSTAISLVAPVRDADSGRPSATRTANVTISAKSVLDVDVHFSGSLGVVFLKISPATSRRIATELGFDQDPPRCWDCSSNDETNRRLVLVLADKKDIDAANKVVTKGLFPSGTYRKINYEEAMRTLFVSTVKDSRAVLLSSALNSAGLSSRRCSSSGSTNRADIIEPKSGRFRSCTAPPSSSTAGCVSPKHSVAPLATMAVPVSGPAESLEPSLTVVAVKNEQFDAGGSSLQQQRKRKLFDSPFAAAESDLGTGQNGRNLASLKPLHSPLLVNVKREETNRADDRPERKRKISRRNSSYPCRPTEHGAKERSL